MAPLAVQTALVSVLEYPSSLQGASNAPPPCREQRGWCSRRAWRQQAGAKAVRLRTRRACSAAADQVTKTVPPVVLTAIPPSLLLFGMSIEAQVAAAGIGGAKEVRGFGVGVMSFWNIARASWQRGRSNRSVACLPTGAASEDER